VRMAKEIERLTGTHKLQSAEGGTNQNGKETKRDTGTHQLESTDGGTGQDGKRNRTSDGHSPTEERRRRNRSKWEKKQTERWPLTPWRAETEEQVRTAKDTDRATGTHELESAERND
jgi:hypothetical protein